MIAGLRLKIMGTILGVVLAVFVIVLGTINIYMNLNSVRQTDSMLDFIAGAERAMDVGEASPADTPVHPPAFLDMPHEAATEAMRRGGFFVARVDADGNVLSLNTERMYDFAESEARVRVAEALASGKARGSAGDLQFVIDTDGEVRILVFAEKSTANHLLSQLMEISVYVLSISGVVLLALSFLLSKWVVRPVEVAFARQRAFISDASHELKTPLTILSANADMLGAEIGPNKWLAGVVTQSGRMNAIVSDLLTLTRLDEQGGEAGKADFDLSELTLNTALEFESIVYEDGKALTYDVQSGVRYHGDASSIKQLLAILIDNAVKHSSPGAEIRVSLADVGGHAQLTVFNTGADAAIEQAELDKLFERFYRSDASRSRETGGVGLGLAIAKSIMELHKGRIAVESKAGEGTWFVVTL